MSNIDILDPLSLLIDAWCERRELRPLALILPAYTSNFGQTDDWARLMEALRDLRSAKALPVEEQIEVERLVPLVERLVYR